MTFDMTVSIGTMLQLIGTVAAGVFIAARLDLQVSGIKEDLKKLADLPLLIARHDERIKHLEKAD